MATVKFWQGRLAEIFPNTGKSVDYIMAHIYTACSDLGRCLLRNDFGEQCDEAIIKAISWLMALATHFKIDFETSVLRRFPKCCPYCIAEPCECDRTGKRARNRGKILSQSEIEQELAARYNSYRFSSQVSFGFLLELFASVYPSNRALLTKGGQGYVTGKMLEEGGELHRAYSARLRGTTDLSSIEHEIADLTAWVISCWDLQGLGKDLDSEFASAFVQGCYLCHKVPCACPSYSITMSQEEVVQRIAQLLRELKGAGVGVDVDGAIDSAQQAALTPTMQTKSSLADKANLVLAMMRTGGQGVKVVDDIAKNLEDAVHHLHHLL
jgi:hypothetical protein